MTEPVLAQDPTETDAERKRRLARERQRRHREKLRRSSAAASASNQPVSRQSLPARLGTSSQPVPSQIAHLDSQEHQQRAAAASLGAGFSEHAFQHHSQHQSQQPSYPNISQRTRQYEHPQPSQQHTQSQHLQQHHDQHQHQQHHRQQDASKQYQHHERDALASTDDARLKAQTQARQHRKKGSHAPQKQVIQTEENASHLNQSHQHPGAHSGVQKGRKSQVLAQASKAQQRVHRSQRGQSTQQQQQQQLQDQHQRMQDEQQHLHDQQQMRLSQQMSRRGESLDLNRSSLTADGILGSNGNSHLVHHSGTFRHEIHASHMVHHHHRPQGHAHGSDNDPTLSHSAALSEAERLGERQRSSRESMRRHPQQFSPELQDPRNLRLGQYQALQEHQRHLHDATQHRGSSADAMALQADLQHSRSIFDSQQHVPQQSPQPPPLQPEQPPSRANDASARGSVYGQRGRERKEHSSQGRRSASHDGHHQPHQQLDSGRHSVDLSGNRYNSSQMVSSFGNQRQYIEKRDGDMYNTGMHHRSEHQNMLNEHHFRQRESDHAVNRSSQAIDGRGHLGRSQSASHRTQPDGSQQQSHLDLMHSHSQAHHPQFALGSHEPSVTGYLHAQQSERHASQMVPSVHGSSQPQNLFLPSAHDSPPAQHVSPPQETAITLNERSKNASLAAAASLTALPGAVNGMHASTALGAAPDNGRTMATQRSSISATQGGFGNGVSFPDLDTPPAQPRDASQAMHVKVTEAVLNTSPETPEQRKRRLARERQRRRRKRIKLEAGKGSEGKSEAKDSDAAAATGNTTALTMTQGSYAVNPSAPPMESQTAGDGQASQAHPVQSQAGSRRSNHGADHLGSSQNTHGALQSIHLQNVIPHHEMVSGAMTAKQGSQRPAFDGSELAAPASRDHTGSTALATAQSQNANSAVVGASQRGSAGFSVGSVDPKSTPPSETQDERKRRLARERQRRRREKLRMSAEGNRGTGSGTGSAPSHTGTEPASARLDSAKRVGTTVTPSVTEAAQMPISSAMAAGIGFPGRNDTESARGARGSEGQRGIDPSQRVQQIPGGVNTSSRNNNVDASVSMGLPGNGSGMAIASGTLETMATATQPGGLPIHWSQVYQSETAARYAVDSAFAGLRGHIENLPPGEQRMYIVQQAIMRLLNIDDVNREALINLLMSIRAD